MANKQISLGELERKLLQCIHCNTALNRKEVERVNEWINQEITWSDFDPAKDKVRPFAILAQAGGIKTDMTTYRRRFGLSDINIEGILFADVDLRVCSLKELLEADVPLKAAKEFLLLTRPNIRYAVLDTIVLSYLRKKGHKAPFKTPIKAQSYGEWELAFIRAAKDENLTCLELHKKIHEKVLDKP